MATCSSTYVPAVGSENLGPGRTPELDTALRALLPEVLACSQWRQAVQRVLAWLGACLPETAISFWHPGADSSCQLLEAVGQPLALSAWETAVRPLCLAAAQEGRLRLSRTSDGIWVLAAPVLYQGQASDVLGLACRQESLARRGAELLQGAGVHLTLWQVGQHLQRQEAELKLAAGLPGVMLAASTATTRTEAGTQLVHGLRSWLGCQRVILGLADERGRNCRIAALTTAARFDPHSDYARALEAALDDVAAGEGVQLAHAGEDGGGSVGLPLRRLVQAEPLVPLAGVPLRAPGKAAQGALLLYLEPQHGWAPGSAERLKGIGEMLGSWWQLIEHVHRSPLLRLRDRLRTRCREQRVRLLGAVLGAVAVLLCLPWPYQITCDCSVEPVVRRYVVAPFDGKLEQSLVQPGDPVRAEQALARMDERELDWELAGLQAELGRAQTRRDSALATHAPGAAQLAELEMQQQTLRIETLEERRKRLVIQSPLDGIVVRGDLKRSEGAPLTAGQSLFEIAPLAEMIAEIEIPETEMAHFAVGTPVELHLEAFPRRAWDGRITRIHPRAELRDSQQVFIAEFAMANPDGILRPGMRGAARLRGPRHLLGWNLFHRAWDKLLQYVGG